MTGKVLVILLILFLLAGCFPRIVERGEITGPIDFVQVQGNGEYSFSSFEIVSWDERECMFIHVWAEDGYRDSLLDCED